MFSKPYPNFGQAVGLLLTVIIVLIAIGLPAALLGHALDLDLSTHPLVMGVMNVIAIGYVVRQALARQGGEFPASLRIRSIDTRFVVPMLGVLAGSAVLISEADNIVVHFYPMPDEFSASLIELATGKHGWISTIFLLNIVAPVTEELLFRGVILRGFLRSYSPRKAVLLTAFLFAAFHLNPWQAFGAFLLGIVFGWWYVRSRSLLPCIVGHAAFNAIPVVLFGIVGIEHPDPLALVEFLPLWLDVLGVLLFTGSGFALERIFQAATPVPAAEWAEMIHRFGDKLLQHARDDYGENTTPLFVSQIDVHTESIPSLKTTLYVTNSSKGAGPNANNLQFDGGLLRLLYGLSDSSGDSVYQEAADDYLDYYLEHLPLPSGHFPWGDHRGYDVIEEDVIDGHGELKVSLPLWDRMWAIDPEAVVRQAEALRNHIIDPTRSLAFDRHYPPGSEPHCMNASAGAWVALWTFTYTRTGDSRYLEWGTEIADYLWSLRCPDTDLLAAHPCDPAYPDMSDRARQRASRTEHLGPMYSYALNLLRSHQMLSPNDDAPYKQQALAYIRAFTRRFDINEKGHFYATFDLKTGDPLFDRVTKGWQITPQARDDEPAGDIVGLHAPISLGYAYLATREPDLKEDFDRFRPLFQIESFLDLDAPPQPVSAGLLAQAIGAWTNTYAATAEYAYLATAAVLGRYAAHHYLVDDWFVCGPPTVPRYRDETLTGWETYSNRGGSADLALALLRLCAISGGRDDLIEDDPTCYF